MDEKVSLFPVIRYSIGKISTEVPTIDVLSGSVNVIETETTYNDFLGGVGLAYFLNDNIGLEAILSHNSQNLEEENRPELSNSSISFNIGFQIYL